MKHHSKHGSKTHEHHHGHLEPHHEHVGHMAHHNTEGKHHHGHASNPLDFKHDGMSHAHAVRRK